MKTLIYIAFAFLFVCSPFFRFLIFKGWRVLAGLPKDIKDYIEHKRWNECKAYGEIKIYTGLFGQGKTKECVRFIVGQYNRYNGRMIYDDATGKWIKQHIVVYSNVQLSIPYIPLTSLQQLVDSMGDHPGIVSLFLIDELSTTLNSRNFKSNLSTPALNVFLTCRHHRIGIYGTSQRFGHVDALLRQVTSTVIDCKYFKPLRIQRLLVYDAWDLENCSNVRLVKPLIRNYVYTTDAEYQAYDTYAMVEDIKKECEEGGFLTDVEILANLGMSGDPRMVNRMNRRYKKRMHG